MSCSQWGRHVNIGIKGKPTTVGKPYFLGKRHILVSHSSFLPPFTNKKVLCDHWQKWVVFRLQIEDFGEWQFKLFIFWQKQQKSSKNYIANMSFILPMKCLALLKWSLIIIILQLILKFLRMELNNHKHYLRRLRFRE